VSRELRWLARVPNFQPVVAALQEDVADAVPELRLAARRAAGLLAPPTPRLLPLFRATRLAGRALSAAADTIEETDPLAALDALDALNAAVGACAEAAHVLTGQIGER
jgi:hypothetical protein